MQECMKCKKFIRKSKKGCWAFNELLAWGSSCPAWTDDPEWQKKLQETIKKYAMQRGLS